MTQLQIINLSLGHLGQSAITQAQLTASVVPSAVYANLFWEPARDDVLGESNWSFANTTLSLSAIDLTDSIWEYAYSYPTLSVGSIWSVFNDGTIDDKDEQEFEVRYVNTLSVNAIFTDLESAYAEFTYKVTDTSLWSNKFIMAFSYRLAAMMAMPLLGDADKGLKLMDISNAYFSETKRVNSSEKKKVPNQSSKYIDSR